jgi:hypothetical protein
MGDGKQAWADEEDAQLERDYKKLCNVRHKNTDPVKLDRSIQNLLDDLERQQLHKSTWKLIEALEKVWMHDDS